MRAQLADTCFRVLNKALYTDDHCVVCNAILSVPSTSVFDVDNKRVFGVGFLLRVAGGLNIRRVTGVLGNWVAAGLITQQGHLYTLDSVELVYIMERRLQAMVEIQRERMMSRSSCSGCGGCTFVPDVDSTDEECCFQCGLRKAAVDTDNHVCDVWNTMLGLSVKYALGYCAPPADYVRVRSHHMEDPHDSEDETMWQSEEEDDDMWEQAVVA